jgi:hypothetical protein
VGSRLFEVTDIHSNGTDTRCRFRVALRWAARLVLISIVGSWLFLYIDSVHQRRRAESLFADLISLDFSTAGFAEVRDIMIRNGARPGATCNPQNCTFRLQIMTQLPRIPLLGRKAIFLYIRLFLTLGSVRGLFMRSLMCETANWTKAERECGSTGWNVWTTMHIVS